MNSNLRYGLLVLALIGIAVATWALNSAKPPVLTEEQKNAALIPIFINATNAASTTASADAETPKDAEARLAAKASKYPRAVDFVTPDGFINAAPFTVASLVGKKVILVDFWTYSCINCIRTLPYLEAWYEKYKDAGLVVIGIHTPEFDFEKIPANVKQAVKNDGITYPVVLDGERLTWSAYQNQYWPHEYLIDIDGFVVHDHIGEGGYEQTEAYIQKLLKERSDVLGLDVAVPSGTVNPGGEKINTTATSLSPETYFGSSRNGHFGNGTPGTSGEQTFTLPMMPVAGDTYYLGGTWNVMPEYSETSQTGARLLYNYNAQFLYFVAAGTDAVVQVLIDGKTISQDMRGADVDADGLMHIRSNRLYKVVKDSAWGRHKIEFVVKSGTLQAFTFTFG